MSSSLWWALVWTIPVALIIMGVAFFVMRSKINNVKNNSMIGKEDSPDNPALNREDHGLLYWSLKQNTKNPLGDFSMEFAINTAIRNKYKRFVIEGFKEEYEETTILRKTKGRISKSTFDFALINFNETVIDNIDKLMQRAEPKSIIMIANAPKDKRVKKLLTYLKYTGIRNEYQKVDLGIILIAK